MTLSRRDFLRASGLAALGAYAAACSKAPPKPTVKTLDGVVGTTQPTHQLVLVGTQVLSGRPERFAFGLFDPRTNMPLPNATARLSYATDKTAVANGPFQATYHGDGLDDRGVYETTITFPADGIYIAVAEITVDGVSSVSSFGQFRVGRAHTMPIVGDRAPSVATPTTKDKRGVNPICTATPPCSMHEISLDTALANGNPTLVVIASPAFCESRLCGPEVQIVDSVRRDATPTMNFIHIENYRDSKAETIQRRILSPGAAAWKLEEEPVIYGIGTDGVILEQALGPVDRANVRDLINRLSS